MIRYNAGSLGRIRYDYHRTFTFLGKQQSMEPGIYDPVFHKKKRESTIKLEINAGWAH